MHLPVTVRRRIAYAATTTLLVAGLAYAAKPGSLVTPATIPAQASAVTTEPSTTDPQPVEMEGEVAAVAQAAAPAEEAKQEAQPKVSTYTVAEGDSVGGIAAKFGLKAETILWSNDMGEDDLLQIGQELKIPSVDGVVHTVTEGDTLWDIASTYNADFAAIVQANPDIDPEGLKLDQVLVIPGGEPPVGRGRGMLASRGEERSAARSGVLSLWPTSGLMTDYFGWRIHPVYGTSHFHDGIDIGVDSGTPVGAAAAGSVAYVGYFGGYGITVKVDHGGGLTTMYCHLSEAAVEVGQSVGAGDLVGYSGSTGASTGPHLHFSVLVDGSPVDPISWLP